MSEIVVSIVIAVLNSHKVVSRQLRHFKRMPLPEDVELVLVDDGSNPPLSPIPGALNLTLLHTYDKRPWTQGLARNMGAAAARGQYLLFTDIDHILTRDAIDAARTFTGDKMSFRRYFGILDRNGSIICDPESMLAFGLSPRHYRRRGLSGGVHGNTYAIRASIFRFLGGYDRRHCEQGFHVGGKYMSEERDFNRRYDRLCLKGEAQWQVLGPNIYHYPTSKFHKDGNNNPHGLFHGLSLEQTPQPCKE